MKEIKTMRIVLTDEELCNLDVKPAHPCFLTLVARNVQDKAGLEYLPRLLSYKYNRLECEHEFNVQLK